MIPFLYNLFLFLGGLVFLPKWAMEKKSRKTIPNRLGFGLPKKVEEEGKVIWIHMVSVGETRAMIPLYEKLKRQDPHAIFFLSTTTQTGKAEAQRSLKGAHAYFYLPLDTAWVMKRLVKRLKPDLLLLAEGDLWYNMARNVRKRGGKVVIVNGKISELSQSRFSRFPTIGKALFSEVDLLLSQNSAYAEAFAPFLPGDRVSVTGNIKQAAIPTLLTLEKKQELAKEYGIEEEMRVVTLGSTHTGEEELLMDALSTIEVDRILVVPRHPERFASVKKILEKRQDPRAVVVDQMGILFSLYQLSDVAIVGGSFLPGVGGHNIFEPVQVSVPVLFGPYMDTQADLVKTILDGEAGIQTSIENLSEALQKILDQWAEYRARAAAVAKKGQQSLEKTWEALQPYL